MVLPLLDFVRRGSRPSCQPPNPPPLPWEAGWWAITAASPTFALAALRTGSEPPLTC